MDKRIPQKIQILKFVAEQGIVSAADVNRYFFTEDKTNVILTTMYQLGLANMWYGNVRGGLWQISDPKLYRLLRAYFPDLSGLKVRHVSVNLAPHYLELNRIRTVFEKSGRFDMVLWMSERLLRAIPVDQRSTICPARVPDAVYWVMKKEGGQKKYFLECERHFNSTQQRYREIFESYFWREDAKDQNVVFLCGDQEVRRRLMAIESKMFLRSGNIRFLTLENFYKEYEGRAVEEAAKVEEARAV